MRSILKLFVFLAVAALSLSASAQDTFNWNGTNYPTQKAAEAAMRAYNVNAGGKGLYLCAEEDDPYQPGATLLKYCVSRKPVDGPGMGGYVVGWYGFSCATNTTPYPGQSQPHNCVGASESYVVSKFDQWFRNESPWAGQCDLQTEVSGGYADPLRYWGAEQGSYLGGVLQYFYTIAYSDRLSDPRRIKFRWRVRESADKCATNFSENSTPIAKSYTYSCPAGYRVMNAPPATLADWPFICKATPSATVITKYGRAAHSCDNVRTDHPCVPATGEKFYFDSDFEWAGHVFRRTYRSMSQQMAFSYMGANWSHSWSARISLPNIAIPSAPAAYVNERNDREEFKPVSGSVTTYRSTNDRKRLLQRQGDGTWVLYGDDGVDRVYSDIGRLLQIRDKGDPARTLHMSYNSAGNLSGVSDGLGRTLTFHYEANIYTDPADELPLMAASTNVLTTIGSSGGSGGSAVTLSNVVVEPKSYRLTEVRDQSSRALVRYTYDGAGRLVQAEYPDATRKTYHYGETNHLCVGATGACVPAHFAYRLTGVTSEDGVRLSDYYFDMYGRAVRSVHAGGAYDTSLTYVAATQAQTQTRVTIAGKGTTTYNFEPPGSTNSYRRPTSAQSADGTRTWQYDYAGAYLRYTDKRGTTTKVEYNSSGRVTRVIEAEGLPQQRSTVTTWPSDMKNRTAVEVQNAAGQAIRRVGFVYNDRSQITAAAVTDVATAATRTTTAQYCELAGMGSGACPVAGLLRSLDGPRTDVTDITTFDYYAADHASCATDALGCPYRKGQLWKVMNAVGHVVEVLRYDIHGKPLSVRDANGVVTDFEYHPRGWLIARKMRGADDAAETDDQILRIAYWPTGLVKTVTAPDGGETHYSYDAAQRLTGIADNAGNTLSFTLDAAGAVMRADTRDSAGALKRTVTNTYNTLGQLQAQTDAYNRSTGFTYDANGALDQTTDALGRVSDNNYDPLQRLTRSLQDMAGVAAETKYSYDALDNLVQVNDPKGLNTSYSYNGFGDLTQLTSPDTGITGYTYDSAGNRKTRTDARGVTSTYNYDVLGRATAIAYPDSTLGVTLVYDVAQSDCAVGETFTVGRLTRMTDGSGSTHYCYDRFGQLTRKVQRTNGKTFTLRYAYDAAGRLTGMTYPDGMSVDYQYNTLGQVSEMGVTRSDGTRQLLLSNALYHAFGPVAEWRYGNGRLLQRPLNQNYEPTVIEDAGAGGISYGYEFDAAGNVIALRNTAQANPSLRNYSYDGLNRLTQVKDGADNSLLQSYAYDKTGNRTSVAEAGITQSYVYASSSHRLNEVRGIARGYDAAGNTTNIGGLRQFVYNNANRLSEVQLSGSVAMRYAYNGSGQQVWRYNATTSRYAVYGEGGEWLGEYDENGQPLQQVFWFNGLPVGVYATAGGETKLHYIQPDALGTPRVVIEVQRNVPVWNWGLEGEAFGNSAPNQDVDGDGTTFVFDMRFPGQRFDAASGLNYNYFRDYDPATGRYVESDPIGLAGGVSTYGYVQGAPLSSSDSLGLFVDSVTWTCMRDSAFCAELFGDIAEGQSDVQRRLGNYCLAEFYDEAADLANSAAPLLEWLDVARGAGKGLTKPIGTSKGAPVLRMADDSPKVTLGRDPNQAYHAFRHTDALGLDRSAVQSGILNHLSTVAHQVTPGKPFNYFVDVAGQRIQYTAFRLPDGTINVGRIHGAP